MIVGRRAPGQLDLAVVLVRPEPRDRVEGLRRRRRPATTARRACPSRWRCPSARRASPRRTVRWASAPRRRRPPHRAPPCRWHRTPPRCRSSGRSPSSQSVFGLTPMPITTRSMSSTAPSVKRMRSTRSPPSISTTPTPRRTSTPVVAVHIGDHRPHLRTEPPLEGHRQGLDQAHVDPPSAARRRHLGADEASADDRHPARTWRRGRPGSRGSRPASAACGRRRGGRCRGVASARLRSRSPGHRTAAAHPRRAAPPALRGRGRWPTDPGASRARGRRACRGRSRARWTRAASSRPGPASTEAVARRGGAARHRRG